LGVRCLTIFSDIKSRKSSAQMQEIQPDLDRIMMKYQNDPKRMNQERSKLMKEKGVSTMSGCLPLLIMMPLLFMFINAFRAWSNEQMLSLLLTMDQDPQAGISLFSQYRFLWIFNIWRPDNLTSSVVLTGEQFWRTFAQTSSTTVDKFIFYTEHQQVLDELLLRMGFFVKDAAGALSIAEDNTVFLTAYETIMGPCIDAYKGYVNGYAILPILAGGTSFLLSWVSMQQQNKNKKETDANNANNQAANMGKGMMYIMPAMSVFFCWQYDATFSIYWILSNVIATAINVIINKKLPAMIERDKQKRAAKLIKESN
ncbi:MAG: membrane protein insertase YidC, partial [Clostridia bacterium]|nr:membrane protein insertase YidC [Clostridia bacterium]